MATVRIYKVAELLDTTSQEVLALLKRDHGIELKSASSTIEEVVARSFVERVARQRNISLPGGDMFAEHPAPAKGGKKAPAAKKPEPPKPAAPVLGPPRLVKVVKPTAPAHEPEPFGDEPATPEPLAQDTARSTPKRRRCTRPCTSRCLRQWRPRQKSSKRRSRPSRNRRRSRSRTPTRPRWQLRHRRPHSQRGGSFRPRFASASRNRGGCRSRPVPSRRPSGRRSRRRA